MQRTVKDVVKRMLRPFNLVVPADVYGARFKIPILRGIGGSHRGGSEPWMVDTLRRLFRSSGRSGLIDVGANIGQTLLKLRSIDRDCRYVGFEPNPFCVQFVKELIALNRFGHSAILPVALAGRAGLIDFVAEGEADSAATMIASLRPNKPSTGKQYIATLRFDDIACDLDVADVPVVKIDVEGAELEVLSGMPRHLEQVRPVVVCEVLHSHTAAQVPCMRERNQALMALLGRVEYVVHRIVKGSRLATVTRLTPVDAFPDEIYNPYSSPAVCDYLFAPRERVDTLERAFAT
jgi:FkbM family methyltransferase